MNQLSLWNEGKTKEKIIDFVKRITNYGSDDFIPEEERIAVFDNDGTLWCEKPLPIQTDFIFQKLAKMAKEDPSLTSEQPWKAIVEKNYPWFESVITKHYQGDDADLKMMSKGLLQAFQDLTVEEYSEEAERFFMDSVHPVYKRSYKECIYQPMVELLRYLEDNGFTNYIASGGGRDFLRVVSGELYQIPPERIIGSSAGLRFHESDDESHVVHIPTLDVFDDGPSKPVRIWSRIGRRPILAVGNANGDIPMLQYCESHERESLVLFVDHDDETREFKYEAQADVLLKEGIKRSWVKISMKKDWNNIFLDHSRRKYEQKAEHPSHLW